MEGIVFAIGKRATGGFRRVGFTAESVRARFCRFCSLLKKNNEKQALLALSVYSCILFVHLNKHGSMRKS
jgi:hypothetical protein